MSSTIAQKRASLAERLGMEPAKLELIRSQCIGPDAPDDVLELYLERCRYMGADPFSKMLYVVNRKKNIKDDYGNWHKEDNWVFQSSIDLFRAIAEENGDYAGQEGPFWTLDGVDWVDVWLHDDPPKACKIAILRNTFQKPMWVTGTYAYYAPKDNKGNVTSNFWKGEKGAHQLAKCVEALALRKAFPQKLNKVYTSEEMEQADRVPSAPALNASEPEAIDAAFETVSEREQGALAASRSDLEPISPPPATQPMPEAPEPPRIAITFKARGSLNALIADQILTPSEIARVVESAVPGKSDFSELEFEDDARKVYKALQEAKRAVSTEPIM